MSSNNNFKRRASVLRSLGSESTRNLSTESNLTSQSEVVTVQHDVSQTQNSLNTSQESQIGSNTNSQEVEINFFEKVKVSTRTNGDIEMLQCLECKKDSIIKYYQLTTAKTNLNYHLEINHNIKISKKIRRTFSAEGIDREKIDRLLLFFLIFCFLPFSIVESKYFKEFIFSLNKEYKVPSRKRLRLLLTEIYNQKKKELIKKLTSINFISLTTDSWTSCQNYCYLGITGHYLEGFKLKSFSLGLKNLVGGHTSENLEFTILEFLEQFNIQNKIFSIVTDNAANIRRTVLDINLEHEPIRCIGHVLQLIVKKFISKCEEIAKIEREILIDQNEIFYFDIGKILSKCRQIVCSFNHSSQLKELLEEQQKEQDQKLNLIQDVKTRWHSTFFMIKRIKQLHPFIESIFHRQEYKNLKPNLLNQDELNKLGELINMLGPFNKISENLSGESYVTSSMILPGFNYIEKKIKVQNKDSDFLKSLKKLLNECFNEYSENYELEGNPFLLASSFLHPFYKNFQFILTPTTRKTYIKIAKDFLINLFKSKRFDQQILKLRKESKDKEENLRKKLNFESESDSEEEDTELLDIKKEIKIYMDDIINEEALVYWEKRQHQYPILSTLASVILAAPATSTPSERHFSDAGYQLWDRRNRLSKSNFEMIMFIFENKDL